MVTLETKLSSMLNEDIGKLILRISIASLMLFHGFKKYTAGIAGIKALVTKAGLPEVLAYGVYMGEIIIPLLLIIGLCTRLSSLVFGGTMAFAIYLVFAEKLLLLDPKTGGLLIELPFLYLLAAVSLFFLGAGKYSLDARMTQCGCKKAS